MKYLLSRNYVDSGPYELFKLVQMAKTGEFQDGKGWYVCEEGKKEWAEIAKIPEIKSALEALVQPKPVGKKPLSSKGKK